ncbi:MAG: ABC transporter permease [Bacteroidales bacterium]|nr:ABC transporter permease [Bacteroidales bacterium]
MINIEKWQEIFHTLKKNKSRSILTAFGVFWGIFMLVIMLAAGNGLQHGVYDGMGDFATNSAFLWGEQTSIAYKGYPEGRGIHFNNSDIRAIRDGVPEIDILAPRIYHWKGYGDDMVVRGLKAGSYTVFGDYPDYNRIDPVTMLYGRYINEFDIMGCRKVCVIGQKVFEELFNNNEDPLNQYIRIQGVYFKIVGVYQSKHKAGWGDWQNSNINVPLTTLQRAYNYGDEIGWFGMVSDPGISVTATLEKVKDILRERHSIHPDDDLAFGNDNLEEEFRQISGLFIAIGAIIWFVGIGTLIAGIVGVSNIMLVIIRERIKEIGIQRALGAPPRRIINQILTESVFLTFVAGQAGLVFGTLIVELLNKTVFAGGGSDEAMFTNPEINFGVAITALIILVLSGLIAGIIPSKRAIKIKPIEAIRFEL